MWVQAWGAGGVRGVRCRGARRGVHCMSALWACATGKCCGQAPGVSVPGGGALRTCTAHEHSAPQLRAAQHFTAKPSAADARRDTDCTAQHSTSQHSTTLHCTAAARHWSGAGQSRTEQRARGASQTQSTDRQHSTDTMTSAGPQAVSAPHPYLASLIAHGGSEWALGRGCGEGLGCRRTQPRGYAPRPLGRVQPRVLAFPVAAGMVGAWFVLCGSQCWRVGEAPCVGCNRPGTWGSR